MFVNAIEEVSKFTKPIHTITRNFNSNSVTPGAATLFFVNELGVAITCKHVTNLIGNRQQINEHYEKYKMEKNAIGKNNKYNQRRKALEATYNYNEGAIIQLQELFIGVTGEQTFKYHWINHPKYDLAIIVFEDFKNAQYQSYARFLRDGSALKQGKFLCRLGFPFPEFTNFKYNNATDNIEWLNAGRIETPRFPIEGMLTRHLIDDGEIFGVELSTPGLRGQSGGPLFNSDGLICGMQSSTNHLHLGFDMKNAEIITNGQSMKITNHPFLHVGHCIHVNIIKNFLSANNVKFYEE